MENLFKALSAKVLQILVLLLLPASQGHAQAHPLLDSLLAQLPRMKEDTNKVSLLHRIADEYFYIDASKGIEYGKQTLELSNKLDYPKGKSLAFLVLGLNYENKADFSNAMDAYFQALKINEAMSDQKGIAACLSNIGNVYLAQNNYDKAEEYYLKALEINRKTGNKVYMSVNLTNLGNIYEKQDRIEEAVKHISEALRLNRENGDKNNEIINLMNFGGIYVKQHNYPSALENFKRSLELAIEVQDQYMEAASAIFLGAMYAEYVRDTSAGLIPLPVSKTVARQLAINSLEKGSKQAAEIGFLDQEMIARKELSEMYALDGNYRASLDNFKQYTVLNDSIHSSENKLKITNLETQRELELRDKQIEIDRLAVAKKRNERVYFISGILALLAIFGIVVRSFILQKRSNRLLSVEKQRSDDLLLNILPAEVAEELKEKGAAEAKFIDEVTVLFSDFKDFTKLSEAQTPRDLVAEINECFSAFDQIMQKYGVEKIKTVGDAYLAAGGLPVPNETHAEDVLNASLEMQSFIQERRRKRESEGNFFFEARIGVHTGPVVAGIVGVKKFAYDIWGDTVNTAQRMEVSGEVGKVNISGSTYDMVKNRFHCTHRGKVNTKGKGEVDMYFVEGSKG